MLAASWPRNSLPLVLIRRIRIRRKNDAYWNNFAVEGASLKDYIHVGRVKKSIKTIFSKMMHHTIKVLAIFYFKHYACVRRLLAVITETSAKTRGLAGS